MAGVAVPSRLFELGSGPARWDRKSHTRKVRLRPLPWWMESNNSSAREEPKANSAPEAGFRWCIWYWVFHSSTVWRSSEQKIGGVLSSPFHFYTLCQPPSCQGLAGLLGHHVLKLPLALIVHVQHIRAGRNRGSSPVQLGPFSRSNLPAVN